jgi:hypothetical protein
VSVRLVLAVLVFVADVWALSRMFRQPFSRGRRIAWIARIVLLRGRVPLVDAGASTNRQ